jgi:tRNA-splicing ligase RtcB (3'-phosphate/5'-hydroxy nucleic acid ligase)
MTITLNNGATLDKKLRSWASILEPETMAQAMTASNMAFIWPHYALMPDAHLGKGATVGSVIPTVGAIMPAAVGVDIGCGMIAHKTSLHADDLANPELRRVIRESIERQVPVSAGGYNHKLWGKCTLRRVRELEELPGALEASEVANWDMQLGTLGSGNHFIEVSVDEDDRVWLFLHSGSRGVGNKLAMKHIKIAQEYCERRWIALPHPDLAYLTEGTQEFDDYIRDLRWAQHFALLNREEMMDRVVAVTESAVACDWYVMDRVNCHHNYTEEMPDALACAFLPNRRPGNPAAHIWLSRKGAIDATEGCPGLIPGSMGAASYVVEGKGDKMSLWSSPHGAGRNLSRGAAKRKFTMDDLEARMLANGTEWRHTDKFLDEHPLAYKDIDVVMEDAKNLVAIKHTLRQIINVKGD